MVAKAHVKHEIEPILISLTRKQIIRLYKKRPVLFIRKGDRFVLRHKEDKVISKVENRIAKLEAKLAVLKERR